MLVAPEIALVAEVVRLHEGSQKDARILTNSATGSYEFGYEFGYKTSTIAHGDLEKPKRHISIH